jgi:hypothetical protein
MKLMNFASVLLISTAIIQPCHAQTSESAIVQAMKRIGSDWQALANSSDVLVVACPDSNFRGIRIIRGCPEDSKRSPSEVAPLNIEVRHALRVAFAGPGATLDCSDRLILIDGSSA